DPRWRRSGSRVPPARPCPPEHHARHVRARVRARAWNRRSEGFDRRRVRVESNLTKFDQIAKLPGPGADPSPQSRPANRMFKLFAGMERAGLEPATPSLQRRRDTYLGVTWRDEMA